MTGISEAMIKLAALIDQYIANAITDFEGSSEYLKGSLVAYTPEAKITLGVPAEVLTMHGVISEETAKAMATAAREKLGADIGIGVTGALAHIGLIMAFEYAEASLVAPFDYGQLIGAAVFGYVIFAELPDLWTWVGAVIIVASGIYVARREAALKRRSALRSP